MHIQVCIEATTLSRQGADKGLAGLVESTNQRRQLPLASSALAPLLQCLTQQVTPALRSLS